MIVKNEEVGIARAINSVKHFVDEIHVSVDRDCKDKTADIAFECGARVRSFVFDDDFAKARNEACEGVTTDWILILDGHEYVKNVEKLHEYLNKDCDGLNITVRMENGTEFRNPRIYKNGLQYEGAVHERMTCTKIITYPDFLIQHARIGGQSDEAIKERDEQRDDQVPRIMGQQIKIHKDNTRALFHLFMHWQARKDYKKAIYFQNQFLKYSNNKEERWYVLFNKSLCRLTSGKYFRAFWSACYADDELPNRWETNKLKGMILFNRKKYEKAIKWLVASFEENKLDYAYKPWERDNSMTWNLIAESYFNLGIYDNAGHAFSEACKEQKNDKLVDFYKKRSELMFDMYKYSLK